MFCAITLNGSKVVEMLSRGFLFLFGNFEVYGPFESEIVSCCCL